MRILDRILGGLGTRIRSWIGGPSDIGGGRSPLSHLFKIFLGSDATQ